MYVTFPSFGSFMFTNHCPQNEAAYVTSIVYNNPGFPEVSSLLSKLVGSALPSTL